MGDPTSVATEAAPSSVGDVQDEKLEVPKFGGGRKKRNNIPANATHRMTFTLSHEVFQALEALAGQDKTMAEVLRDSITLEKWLQDAVKDGFKILLEKDGQVRELLIR